MMDVAYLRTRLRYEPETGKLFWLTSPRNGWVGREAFTATDTHGYRHGTLDGRTVRAHRVVWALFHGVWPEHEIDHENRDRSDNRPGNLRPADDVLTARNCSLSKANTSGVKGVCWSPGKGKWVAQIGVDGKPRHLGYFDDLAAAVAVRQRAEQEHSYP